MQLMALVHFLLNVAGLLLWLRWREERMHAARRGTGGTLLGTLRRASAGRAAQWTWLALLVGLVILRGVGYWHMGSAVRWTPSIDFGAVLISFRSDLFGRALLFSFCSMALFVLQFHFWLLLLAAVNRRVPDSDLFQNRVRAHLGWLDRLPSPLKLLFPGLFTAALWLGLGPLLVRLGYLLPVASYGQVAQQAVLIGLGAWTTWQYLIATLLLLHLLTSYVYLGHAPFWSFVTATGQNLLVPLRWLPFLRMGRIDLAPVAGAAIVLFLGEWAARWLPAWYQRLPWF